MDLSTVSGLTQACQQVVAAREGDEGNQDWTRRLSELISTARSASIEQFGSADFQKNLWESEAVSATGMGSVPTQALWQDPIVVGKLREIQKLDDKLSSNERTEWLIRAWDALIGHIRGLGQRIPRLKLARVFAALKPADFTTLASEAALLQVAKAMQVGSAGDHVVLLHRRVLDRLDAVLPNVKRSSIEDRLLLRMKLPWMLFEDLSQVPAKGVTIEAGDRPGTVQLTPLPANRRRRGLLAIGGGLPSILAMLQFVEEGCTRTDFREHIHSVNPNLAPASIETEINALIAEWGAVHAQGDQITLTARGRALLESGDPDEVSDWLLTQILGFDNALYLLREGPKEQKELVSAIQAVNPGWTSNFAPTVMINWLRSLDLVEYKKEGKLLALSPRGQDWLGRIHWQPGTLTASVQVEPQPGDKPEPQRHELARPALRDIIASFRRDLLFPSELIARLDAALWSHSRRHFAVLTGLSGSGKTELARNYAKSLWQGEPSSASTGLYVLPVQPGWHDPTPLLGYVNPLKTDDYVRTTFLKFLLNAARDPDRPYTVVLDEMNLSHPEQYLAPLLSAMETGDAIELHAQGDEVDEIPSRIAYPSNLVIIGTINMDETTHGLSDKVLDRASVIEFWDIDVNAWPGWESCDLPDEQCSKVKQVLRELIAALAPVRLHFGWRTIENVVGYLQAARDGGEIRFNKALDQAVYAKVLPKLRGEDSAPLQKALQTTLGVLKQHELRQSASKLDQLCLELTNLGIARFWR